MQETWVQSLGGEDPLEKGMATHSSILAWRIPWTEEPGGYNLWGFKELDTIEQLTYTHTHTHTHTTHTHTHTHTYICQGVLKHYIPYLMNQSLTRLLGILVLVSHSVRKQRMAATEPPTSSGLLPCQPPLQGPQDSCHKVLLESAPR